MKVKDWIKILSYLPEDAELKMDLDLGPTDLEWLDIIIFPDRKTIFFTEPYCVGIEKNTVEEVREFGIDVDNLPSYMRFIMFGYCMLTDEERTHLQGVKESQHKQVFDILYKLESENDC